VWLYPVFDALSIATGDGEKAVRLVAGGDQFGKSGLTATRWARRASFLVLRTVYSRDARTAVPMSEIESNRTLRLTIGLVMVSFLVSTAVDKNGAARDTLTSRIA
jgi:hypothetical protein